MTKASKNKAPSKPASKPASKPTSKPTGKTASKPEKAEKIGKTQLVDLVAGTAGLSKKDTATLIDATLFVIGQALVNGQSVGLPGLGTLSVRATVARTGVRPGTNEKIEIPAGRKISYKVASDLKASL